MFCVLFFQTFVELNAFYFAAESNYHDNNPRNGENNGFAPENINYRIWIMTNESNDVALGCEWPLLNAKRAVDLIRNSAFFRWCEQTNQDFFSFSEHSLDERTFHTVRRDELSQTIYNDRASFTGENVHCDLWPTIGRLNYFKHDSECFWIDRKALSSFYFDGPSVWVNGLRYGLPCHDSCWTFSIWPSDRESWQT